jgi:hypothetical protein
MNLFLLEIESENVVVQVVRSVETTESTLWKGCHFICDITVRVLVDNRYLVSCHELVRVVVCKFDIDVVPRVHDTRISHHDIARWLEIYVPTT